ncbi:MAG: CpsD/CapB family tyrosine-protein kinase [Clostridia bacterium]|nr:CpsD/CapB family tyrosine-protein kinase [Clostridia bacterium]
MLNVGLEKINFPYAYTEELKQLRTNIEFAGSDKKVFLITSAFANEGKSTLALELSRSFAELGKNTLLIDADMRLSNLASKRTGKSPAPKGLSHLLSGQVAMDQVLHQTETNHMYVIFSGRVPPNPAELLANKKMKMLIDWARANFDYIFIDCPPIKLVADTSIIATHADASLVVIKSEAVPRKIAQDVIKQLEMAHCPIVGVVLNQVKQKRKYYKNGYNSYYGKSERPAQTKKPT